MRLSLGPSSWPSWPSSSSSSSSSPRRGAAGDGCDIYTDPVRRLKVEPVLADASRERLDKININSLAPLLLFWPIDYRFSKISLSPILILWKSKSVMQPLNGSPKMINGRIEKFLESLSNLPF